VKLILSRKGFDSAAGGVASPILPDGRMISLPIPDPRSPIRYADVIVHGHNLGKLVADLTAGKHAPESTAHLDPDIVGDAYPRAPGWRPLFGQAGGEQTVLARANVGRNDLFLFFGWFRRVELVSGTFRFIRGSPDLHVLWGWLQVARVVPLAATAATAPPPWARYHPHVVAPHRTNNTLYVGRSTLALAGMSKRLAGAGTFGLFDERLVLTKPGASRTSWSLPAWFHPGARRPPLGYHATPARWSRVNDRTELRSVSRGQEFVLDVAAYPEAIPWLGALIGRARAAAARPARPSG
jgi:hypothetical protein